MRQEMPATDPLCPSLNGSQQAASVVTTVPHAVPACEKRFSHIQRRGMREPCAERDAADVLSQAHALDKSGQEAFG